MDRNTKTINYPDHPENNVKYHYGGINSSYNRIGRLMLRECTLSNKSAQYR
ncbi:hypothetical protein [Prevotella aurantiaca]|uniref:hypothetical protein n=1 Tax=Prevotella aurantiaca TaxID=596085 RepID=UPI0023EFD21A